jgi:predicted enzyme related to lactoylglutathione lyase
MRRRHPDQPCVNTIDAGGLNAVAKMPIPTVGWLACCKDVAGHIFGLMEADPEAK